MTKFCFFNYKDIPKINFDEINEMNEEILLHSPDSETFLISWNKNTPTFIYNFDYDYLILEYEESLQFITNNNWKVFN